MPIGSAGTHRMTQRADSIDLGPTRPGGVLPRIDARRLAMGGSIALVCWLALVPVGFLLWQSFLTPETPTAPARLTLDNYRTAYASA